MRFLSNQKSGFAVRCGVLVALAMTSLISWQHYRAQVQQFEQAQERLDRCRGMARELIALTNEDSHVELGSVHYEPGPSVFETVRSLSIPVDARFSVTKSPPASERGSHIAHVPVELPPMVMTMAQVFDFMDAMRGLPVPHHFTQVNLAARSSDSDDEHDRWESRFVVGYYIPASDVERSRR